MSIQVRKSILHETICKMGSSMNHTLICVTWGGSVNSRAQDATISGGKIYLCYCILPSRGGDMVTADKCVKRVC